MKLFGTMEINEDDVLEVGGCSTTDLVEAFGTPLYIVDERLIRENCQRFRNGFQKAGMETEVIYASKAFLNMAMCTVVHQEDLSLDVVSGGELYTAMKAGFPMEKIYFHGNNKTDEELIMALELGVGRIIVDNRQEIGRLEKLCSEMSKTAELLLRVNPGIEAHTHEYIQTAKHDSKFGESIYDEGLWGIITGCIHSKHLQLRGFHCHIGSQIFEEKSFYATVRVMADFLWKIKQICDFNTQELNLGGGFGIYYTHEDTPVQLEVCLEKMLDTLQQEIGHTGLSMPKVMIEPGRAIVANAGSTLYRVGGVKHTYGGKQFVFVDGGMTDNPRPALYKARYEACIANKAGAKPLSSVTIAGKCCESGDIIIHDIELPEVEIGDVICVASTGAYNYSMASNYNRIARAAVVFVANGQSKLVVKRETFEDLIKNDLAY